MSGRGGRDRVGWDRAGSSAFECGSLRSLTASASSSGYVLSGLGYTKSLSGRARFFGACNGAGGGRAISWERPCGVERARKRGRGHAVRSRCAGQRGVPQGPSPLLGGLFRACRRYSRAGGLRAKGGGLPETDAGPIVTSSRVVDGPAMARDELAGRIYHAGATRLARPRGGGPRGLASQGEARLLAPITCQICTRRYNLFVQVHS